MAKIVMQEAAFEDIERLYGFLDNIVGAAAKRAVRNIDQGIVRLARYPELVPTLNGEYRVLSIPFGKKGFSVAYVYEPEYDEVVILGIKHQLEEYYPFELEQPAGDDDDT